LHGLPRPARRPTSGLAENAPFVVTVPQMMRFLRTARPWPSENTNYGDIYTMPDYCRDIRKKLRLMKSEVTMENVARAIADYKYWNEFERIKNTYPQHGGRHNLYLLIGEK
jgi:hypothetical protein